MMLDGAKFDDSTLPFRLPSPASAGLLTSLEAVEAVLSEQASKLGVDVRRGVTVSSLTHDEEGVVAR